MEVKGQGAETARELTLGNEVPSPRPQLRPGLARTWCVHRDPGCPHQGLRTSKGALDFRDAKPRSEPDSDLGPVGEDRLKENQPGCGARSRSTRMGKPVATLSEARPLGLFRLFWGFYRGRRSREARDSGRRGGWRGEEVLNTTFLGGFVNRGGPC